MPRECGHQSPGQQYMPFGVCPLCDLDFALESGDVARKLWRHHRAPLVQWMRENGTAEWPCDEHEPSGEEVALASFCCSGSHGAKERCSRCGELVEWHAFPGRKPPEIKVISVEALDAKLAKYELLPIQWICLIHLEPEPCPTCAAHIAGGL